MARFMQHNDQSGFSHPEELVPELWQAVVFKQNSLPPDVKVVKDCACAVESLLNGPGLECGVL